MGVLTVVAALVAVVLALVLALVAFIGSMTNVAPGAIAASLRTRKPGKLSLPKSGLSLEASTVAVGRDNILDLAKARAWMGFCEFAAPDTSPISCIYTFPMLAANLFREVISSEDFPLSVMGIIHCRQVVDQYALMTEATVGAYDYRVAVSAGRVVDTGAECDMTMDVFSAVGASKGTLVNRTVMTVTSTDAKKAKKASKARAPLSDEEKKKKTMLEEVAKAHTFDAKIAPNHSVKYAAVSGDNNPIHHPTFCKLMGMPKPIMHGLWSLGRAVAAVTAEFKLANVARVHVDCAWKMPMPVPGAAKFEFGELVPAKASAPLKEELAKLSDCKRHVEFLVTREQKGKNGGPAVKLPHLRGVVSF